MLGKYGAYRYLQRQTPARFLQVKENEVGQKAPKQTCVPSTKAPSPRRIGNVLRDIAVPSCDSEVHTLITIKP